MNADERKMMRRVMAKVHPDLFAAHVYESQCNSDSLKLLFSYVEELSAGRTARATKLQFYVKEGAELRLIEVQLPSPGSILPLFFSFNLITAEQLREATAAEQMDGSTSDTDFLSWMRDTVSEAILTAEQHDALKLSVRQTRADLERKYGLKSVQVGSEYAQSLAEQGRQLEALQQLALALDTLASESGGSTGLEDIALQLYHAGTAPMETFCGSDPVSGAFSMRTGTMAAHIGDDGSVHIVADPLTLAGQLRVLEVEKARTLGKATAFWQRRVRELTPALTDLLGVRGVWCDTKTEQNSQKFVIWAGYVLEKRDDIALLLQGRRFSFSLIVHSDPSGPLINFTTSSPILNLRSDCPPAHLLEFLLSDTGTAASDASNEVHTSRALEDALLEDVRRAFDAKCVIKICMNDKVLEGARRLLENAEVIKQAVDLRGACIALDDCYEVWDSGFISIPYNFKIQELPSMVRSLQSGQRTGTSAASVEEAAASGTGGGTSGHVEQPQQAFPSSSGRRAMAQVSASKAQARPSLAKGLYGRGVQHLRGPMHVRLSGPRSPACHAGHGLLHGQRQRAALPQHSAGRLRMALG